ncbi:reversion-inducing-cysteine-rich protein with kazal motifs [Musca autumnalis]|uniref:reversion-inducing-cysteine-rich protein with kazal motifs n=1 Tax=Musca autumnalis TaxID=221902 RepID=UPI003CEC094A
MQNSSFQRLRIYQFQLLIAAGLLLLLLMPALVTSVRHIDNDDEYHDEQQQLLRQQLQLRYQQQQQKQLQQSHHNQRHQKDQQLQQRRRSSGFTSTSAANHRPNESQQHWKRINKQYYTSVGTPNYYNNNNNNKLSMALTKYPQSAEAQYADDEEDPNDNQYHLRDENTDDGDEDDDDDMYSEDSTDVEASVGSVRSPNVKQNMQHPPYDFYNCCNEVFGSCRTSCENLSLVQLSPSDVNGRSIRLEMKKYCPSMQLEFWSCMNRTLEAVARGSQWSGRRCCALGVSPRCSNACATMSSTGELINACRQSDEQHMFACFERQEAGDRCCGNAKTPECLQACREIFEPHPSHKRNNRRHLHEMCGEKNADVIQCVKNVTDMSPITNSHKYLPCCDFSDNDSCRNTCRAVLNTTESTDIIIGELETGGCGTVLPHLPLWQCFFTAERKMFVPAVSVNNHETEVSQINRLGIDGAKLHCCEKVLSAKCRRLCLQTFTTDWTNTMNNFEEACLMQPNEVELRQCIDEVDEPCELGCDGLSFCTNFNNRPTELFRSCTVEADMAAKSDLMMWQQRGFVSLPGVNLPIKNMTRCSPEKWKAIACILQTKPCSRQGHYNHICRENCYEILSECMDWTRMNTSLNADAICARLHPEGEGVHCISLRPYLEESDAPKDTGGHHRITSPCKGHPCNASEVCLAARNGSATYECIPGCALGETSNYLVPFGAYVRIPVQLTASRGGFKVCRCGMQGRIEHCQPLPSVSFESCVLPGGRKIKHGTSFYLECNLCTCYAEEITCTKKQCKTTVYTDVSYTSLPCNCPTHYVPVCGINGRTYPSLCIARCLGLQDSDLEYGACSVWNPCAPGAYQCPAGMQCVEHRQICLSSMHRPCLQYKCVNQTLPCEASDQPVCDTKGITYKSACDLFNAKSSFAHWGPCSRGCSWKGPVCGINGVNYPSECAAWSDYVLVDYKGRCREVGLLSHDLERKRCRLVKCPDLPSPYCQAITPPGACCPLCASAFRVIYSRKQIDRALYALRGQHKDLLTLRSVLHELDSLIQVTECQLTGFLTMEVGIFVAIVPRASTPTRMQIEACTREAEKLSSFITAQSHKITTNLILSGLTMSNMLDPSIENSSMRWMEGTNCLLIMLLLGGIMLMGLWRNKYLS